MANKCQRFLVAGKVQGVFYRNAAVKKAESLGVRGWVRNLSDGKVEVLACGEEKIVDALARWLWEGSEQSRVDSVRAEMVPGDIDQVDFYIRY